MPKSEPAGRRSPETASPISPSSSAIRASMPRSTRRGGRRKRTATTCPSGTAPKPRRRVIRTRRPPPRTGSAGSSGNRTGAASATDRCGGGEEASFRASQWPGSRFLGAASKDLSETVGADRFVLLLIRQLDQGWRAPCQRRADRCLHQHLSQGNGGISSSATRHIHAVKSGRASIISRRDASNSSSAFGGTI